MPKIVDILFSKEYTISQIYVTQSKKEEAWIVWKNSKELGMSQLELAKDIGVSRQTINMDWKRQVQSNPELWSQSRPQPPTDLNSLFFGRMIFKKEQTHEKKPLLKNWSNAHTAFEPFDEYKRREADRIGNQVFIILFYLMIFGNLIPPRSSL